MSYIIVFFFKRCYISLGIINMNLQNGLGTPIVRSHLSVTTWNGQALIGTTFNKLQDRSVINEINKHTVSQRII